MSCCMTQTAVTIKWTLPHKLTPREEPDEHEMEDIKPLEQPDEHEQRLVELKPPTVKVRGLRELKRSIHRSIKRNCSNRKRRL